MDFSDEIQMTSICLTPDAKFSLRSLLNMYMMYMKTNVTFHEWNSAIRI